MMSVQQVSLESCVGSTTMSNVVEEPKRGKKVKIRKLKVKTPKIDNIITPDPYIEKTKEEKIVSSIEENVLSHLGNYTEEPFELIQSYFRGQHLERLVRHQIESYNHFINYQIQRTIQMFNNVKISSENDYVPEKDMYLLEIDISFDKSNALIYFCANST